MATSELPLGDVSVLDFGQAISGPICATFLADLGADVVKVERPTGDVYRINRREKDGVGFNPPFEVYNRNKRGLSIDVKSDEGLAIIYDLLEKTDIMVQNWPPGVAGKLGLDYETVQEYNSDLVYVHVTGYGEEGPAANQPAMDAIVQHVSGFASTLGYEGDPPIRAQSSVADFYAGYNAALSALAALRAAERGEGGQKVDISMLQSTMHAADGAFEYHLNCDEEIPRGGRNNFALPDMLYGAAEAQDGWVAVALLVYSDRIFEAFCELVGREDLLEEPRYADDAERMADAAKFTAIFEEWLADQTVEDALDALLDAGIPAGKHNTVSEAAQLEHNEAVNAFVDVEHPRLGTLELSDTPLDLERGEPTIRSPAPIRGEDNEAILREAGFDTDDIERLQAEGVLSTDL
ncbi:MAG: CaiB/BaiF CoA transferase family protein [Salinirussus sp.]